MCELILVRHGQTKDNIQQILAGQQGGELTELGFKQANNTGMRLKQSNFDMIYCSDLNRTKQTLETILAHFKNKNIDIEYNPLLREKSAGVLEGLPLKVFKLQADESQKPIREFKPDKGECWVDVYSRAEKFLQHLMISGVSKPNIIEEYKQDIQSDDIEQKTEQKQDNNSKNQEQKLIKNQQKPEKQTKNSKQSIKPIPKILVITHGGFIMEFHNLINQLLQKQKKLPKKDPVYNNSAKNCSLHQFYIQCSREKYFCGQKCLNLDCLTIQIGLKNDDSHCQQDWKKNEKKKPKK